MSELEIIALFTPTEDHVHSVEDLLKAAVAPSRAEPGNVAYTVRRLEGTPARFAVLERWADDEAFAAHGQTPHSGAAPALRGGATARPCSRPGRARATSTSRPSASTAATPAERPARGWAVWN